VVVQRVTGARASSDGEPVASIGPGLVVFAGFSRSDSGEIVRRLAGKIARARIFERSGSLFGASVLDTGGEVLTVAQLPLMADFARGAKPGFQDAASPERSRALYELLGDALLATGVVSVVQAPFGTRLALGVDSWGPFTIVLEG